MVEAGEVCRQGSHTTGVKEGAQGRQKRDASFGRGDIKIPEDEHVIDSVASVLVGQHGPGPLLATDLNDQDPHSFDTRPLIVHHLALHPAGAS